MESILIAVTTLALAVAVAMAVLAWRLLREERRRADARVSALVEFAAREGDDTVPPPRPEGRPAPASARPTAPHPAASAAFDLPLGNDSPVGPRAAPGAAIGSLFDVPKPATQGPPRAAALALVAVAMAAAVWVTRDVGGTGSVSAAPVELVSLAHDRQDDTLRITGLVQNPRDGVEHRDVVAVAFLFDAAGTLVASGQSPLDFTRLAPGDESPFVILVPHAGGVARYRLGFRTDDGRVLAHVDRRSDPAAAGASGAAARPVAGLAARAAR